MKHDFSYEDIQEAVSGRPGSGSAAEAHGLLSGMLCVDLGVNSRQWLRDFFGSEVMLPQGDEASRLNALFETTRRQLDDFDFSFEPLLPDDESPLEERALALGEWCQGFLLGVGYAGQNSGWPGECTEILRDLLEIGRLDPPEAAGEADETAYAELSEYVRVGVQVIRSEFHSQTPRQLH
jgi:hypothetical protein